MFTPPLYKGMNPERVSQGLGAQPRHLYVGEHVEEPSKYILGHLSTLTDLDYEVWGALTRTEEIEELERNAGGEILDMPPHEADIAKRVYDLIGDQVGEGTLGVLMDMVWLYGYRVRKFSKIDDRAGVSLPGDPYLTQYND